MRLTADRQANGQSASANVAKRYRTLVKMLCREGVLIERNGRLVIRKGRK